MKSERAIIVAYGDGNRVIGNRGQMPWMGKMPADLQRVRELTKNQAIIMGQKTFESIGRPLPKRQNIVLSRDLNLQQELAKYEQNMVTNKPWDDFMLRQPQPTSPLIDFVSRGEIDVAFSFEEAFSLVKPSRTAFIFGGASVYVQALQQNLADVVYATEIHGQFDGDAFFPALDLKIWREVERQDFPADAKNYYPYSFVKYEKVEQGENDVKV